jgi:hypothetical protein
MWSALTSSTITSCTPNATTGDTALTSSINYDNDSNGRSDRAFLTNANPNDGNLWLTLQASGSGTSCTGPYHSVYLGPKISARVVVFPGIDGSGDGKPDFWIVNTHSMAWSYVRSQDFAAVEIGVHGEAWDVPL